MNDFVTYPFFEGIWEEIKEGYVASGLAAGGGAWPMPIRNEPLSNLIANFDDDHAISTIYYIVLTNLIKTRGGIRLLGLGALDNKKSDEKLYKDFMGL